ncbi:MAG: cysteine peptidase family C39 domain-containing protein [Planctomycetota bacterium]|nr:cysteine peptidase family C39 domain-containing protein [Planctomycetota bacterium]
MLRFVLTTLFLVAAFVCGLVVGRRAKRGVPLAIGGICLALLGLRYFLNERIDLEYALLPFDFYVDVRMLWACAVGEVILGIGVGATRSRVWRGAILGVAAAFASMIVFTFGLLSTEQYLGLNSNPPTSQHYQQSSGYSCGPAAAGAILLFLHGIKVSEREFGIVAGTSSCGGTSLFAAAKALRRFAGPLGYRVRVLKPTWEELKKLKPPCMVTEKLTGLVDHWVVIKEFRDGKLVILNPLDGLMEPTEDEFRSIWRGDAVVLER